VRFTSERERRRLASVASEYQERGYEVKLQPTGADLPDFMVGFEPDLIATGKGESVVVEVKARNEVANNQDVSALEAAIRNRPGWRFELIIDGLDSEDAALLGPHQIEALLEEANQLQIRGHVVAGLLLMWSATEGILRLLAARENVGLESPAPGYVTKRLYTLGLLGRDQYRILDEAVRLRNQAAHGFQVSVTQQDLARITAVARELLIELGSKAA
jgi:REase_AHJR-like